MTGELKNRKRKYQRRPGLKQAAVTLGCTYENLRAVVIGERQSRNLLARYQALVATDPQPTTKGKS